MTQETPISTVRSGQSLGTSGLKRLLQTWAPEDDQPASTLYVKAESARAAELQRHLSGLGPDGQSWWERLSALDRSVLTSDTGLAAFRNGPEAVLVIPPFPVLENLLSSSWDPEPLLEILETEYTIGVVLLRLGRFSAAVYRGSKLLTSKTDARYVKGRHHAGGTSQKRFQRIREGQARKLYDKACEATQAQLGPYNAELDYILLGGDKFTLEGFLKVCPYLESRRDKILDRRLNVRDPKRDMLEEVAGILTQSRVYPLAW